MTITEFKHILPNLEDLAFKLEHGTFIPEHFHITEIGVISKHFIDCGGTVRIEKVVNFQIWYANDFQHKLNPKKLLNIIKLSEKKLQLEELEIEVEYQGHTIEKYGLDFNGTHFVLTTKKTNCLAQDKCGIPPEQLDVYQPEKSTCTPGAGCC